MTQKLNQDDSGAALNSDDITERGLEWNRVPAAIWRARRGILRPVTRLDPVRFSDLLGVDRQVAALRHNTERFLRGLPANNVLLWGARGTGKSSLIKALLNEYVTEGLRIIEVDKNDLLDLNDIIDDIRDESHRFVIYCDDLSFDAGESQYKALKSALEGSIELPPDNVLVYATSNRRHLLPEYMSDNDNSKVVDGELHHGEAVEEKISLSDRFGLWLSFYPISQDEYLNIVDHLFPAVQERSALHRAALKFAYTKGVRSGRAAKQFYRAYSGEFN